MKRYLVTGVAGFIGSAIARSLVLRGEEVFGIDDLSIGSKANLYPFTHAIRLYQADIRDEGRLAKAMEGVDVIFHEAAITSVQRCIEEPVETESVNVGAVARMIEIARNAGVRRIVFASSSSVYGEPGRLPTSESATALPLTPYARQKLAAEELLRSANKRHEIETVSLRYFHVFGPRQASSAQHAGVIARLIRLMLGQENARPQIFGDGEQTRDFVYIDDVVAANLAAAEAPRAGVCGKAFNIASGEAHTINQVAEMIAAKTGYLQSVSHTAARAGEVHHAQAELSLAQRNLGYKPRISLAEGLTKTIEWYRAKDTTIRAKARTAPSSSMDSLRQRERDGLVEDLREAIRCGNFHIVFQPILSAKERRLNGAEALLRWQNRGKVIPANRFIPLAEEIGMIEKLGTWTILHACSLFHQIVPYIGSDFRLSVNCSPSQLESEAICEVIASALKSTKIEPHQFEVEITERAYVHDMAKIRVTINRIRRMGVSIAIDDFGTGYSDMEALCRLKMNRIKINRSLSTVSRTQLPVFEGIVQMAHRMNLTVTAEGIESQPQLERVRAADCDEVQGYFLAKPMSTSQLSEYCSSFSLPQSV